MVEIGRTEEEVLALLADFGTQDPEIAKRTLNFIPVGLEGTLAALDECTNALGYYAQDIAMYVEYLRLNILGIEGRGRDDLLLGISQKAMAKQIRYVPRLHTLRREEEDEG